MRVIAFVNLKGGVAKTTTVANAAAILTKIHRKDVLYVDADSQCNLTEFFGPAPNRSRRWPRWRARRSGEIPQKESCHLNMMQ